jgi:hypothetical protein
VRSCASLPALSGICRCRNRSSRQGVEYNGMLYYNT